MLYAININVHAIHEDISGFNTCLTPLVYLKCFHVLIIYLKSVYPLEKLQRYLKCHSYG